MRACVCSSTSRTGRPLLDTPAAKVLASLAGFAERDRARDGPGRTYDALGRKAKAGHVAGGIVFGYQNVRVDGHVERRIHEPEAAVVRRIFDRLRARHRVEGARRHLTREQAPVPMPRRRIGSPAGRPRPFTRCSAGSSTSAS